MPNNAHIEEVMSHILMHPESHNQESWGVKTDCGTVHCAAGWSAVLSGAKPIWSGRSVIFAQYCITPGGNLRKFFSYAQEMMGLDEDTAEKLFLADQDTTEQTVDKLKHILNNGSLDDYPEVIP
jgi:hypothetical protein